MSEKKKIDIAGIVKKILDGDRVTLSQAITLIESTRIDHQQAAQKIIKACLPHSGNSFRIGITGAPGVGKSTFIDALGSYVVNQGKKIAVLAIDPSSQKNKGSILGDKTRMEKLANHPQAFIRPSPAGNTLGGVSRRTRETIILCEAAGFNTIFVETVGVGQSEIAVHSMVDFLLLLLLPGAGDELQGIKKGIVEIADALVINKAESDREQMAKQTRKSYRNAIHLYPPKPSGYPTEILLCSALYQTGIEKIWQTIKSYKTFTQKNNYFKKHREQQANYWLLETIREGVLQSFFQNSKIQKELQAIKTQVQKGTRSPFEAAEYLLKLYRKGE